MPPSNDVPGLRALFRNRDYLRLWVAATVSGFGSTMSAITITLLALYVTGSPARAALVASCSAGGRIVALIPGGAVADRHNRKHVLVVANLVAFAAVGWLVALIYADALVFWQLIVVGFVLGVTSSVFGPAEQATLKEVVPSEQLGVALSQNQARAFAASLAGGPVGGLLYGIHRAFPFVGDAISYALAALLISRLKTDLSVEQARVERTSFLADARAGFRFIWSDGFMRAAALYGILGNIAGQVLFMVLVLSLAAAAVAPATIGLLQTAMAVSGLAGALVAPWLIRRVSNGRLAILASGVAGVAVLGMALSSSVLWLYLMLGLALILAPAGNSGVRAYLFSITPSAMQGRASASLVFGASIATPMAPLLGGLFLSSFGRAGALVGVAILFGLSVLPMALSREARRLSVPTAYAEASERAEVRVTS